MRVPTRRPPRSPELLIKLIKQVTTEVPVKILRLLAARLIMHFWRISPHLAILVCAFPSRPRSRPREVAWLEAWLVLVPLGKIQTIQHAAKYIASQPDMKFEVL